MKFPPQHDAPGAYRSRILGPNQIRAIEQRHPWVKPLREARAAADRENDRLRQMGLDVDQRLHLLRSRLPRE